jgi:predicted lipoprotein with Yx(FWY)xxD motif
MKRILPAASPSSGRRLATAATAARYAGALALLAVGIDHIEQYYVDYYSAVPTIGTLFALNFVSALVIGIGLVMPLHRIARSSADRILTVLAISGIGIGAGTLAGLLISENGGLFGFMEVGYRGAIVLSIVFDVATVVLLGAFLVLRALQRRHPAVAAPRNLPGPAHRKHLTGMMAVGAGVVALVIAGCGGGGSANGSSASTASSAGGGAKLRVTTDPTLGKIIVDAKGRTLYDFPIDKGTMSVCYGACASLWPPLTTHGQPVAGAGVSAGLIGTSARHDGTTEVTYAGHPLYCYAPDRTRGQITGQALDQFGAPWYALAPNGREIHTPAK